MPKRQPERPWLDHEKVGLHTGMHWRFFGRGRQFKPRPVRWRELQKAKGRQKMTNKEAQAPQAVAKPCKTCDGYGGLRGHPCPDCKGSGEEDSQGVKP